VDLNFLVNFNIAIDEIEAIYEMDLNSAE